MKSPIKLLLLLPAFICIISCKKNDADGTNPAVVPVPAGCELSPYKTGTAITFSLAAGGNYKATFVKDTLINGNTYVKSTSTLSTDYYRVGANGDVYKAVLPLGDVPLNEMVYIKQNQATGAVWSYSIASTLAPSLIIYKYTYTVLATNVSFTLNGKTYTNCIKVKQAADVYAGGTLSATNGTTILTWACGLGFIAKEENGSLQSSLIDYVY